MSSPSLIMLTTNHGQEGRDGPLTLIRAVTTATTTIITTWSRARLFPALGDQKLARPRRHPALLEAATNDEQRRDEDAAGSLRPARGWRRSRSPSPRAQGSAARHQHDVPS